MHCNPLNRYQGFKSIVEKLPTPFMAAVKTDKYALHIKRLGHQALMI